MILTTLLLLFQLPEAEDPRRLFAAGPKEAYYMEPPEAVTKPFVHRMAWTVDGSSLLVERYVAPAGTPPLVMADALQEDRLEGVLKLHPRIQLVAWSPRNRVARTLLDLDPERAAIEEFEPMAGTDQVLVVSTETPARSGGGAAASVTFTYSLLSASSGTVRRVWSGSAPLRYALSPKRPVGAFYLSTGAGPQRIVLFGPDGKPGTPLTLPARARFGFSAAGLPGANVVTTDARGKRSAQFRVIDPRTGSLGAVVTEQFFEEPATPPLRVLPWQTKEGTNGILLMAGADRKSDMKPNEVGIVTSDGTLPSLSPKNDAIAYVSGHGAFVRPLVKVDRKSYDAAILEAGKQKAIRYAKQMGTAMAMYSADCDDGFPPAGGAGKEAAYPYLRNRSALDAFTYTFGGGSVSGNPGETELGYVSGPGGRAVVYADGSIKWLPDGV
jgi:hypothetical protein